MRAAVDILASLGVGGWCLLALLAAALLWAVSINLPKGSGKKAWLRVRLVCWVIWSASLICLAWLYAGYVAVGAVGFLTGTQMLHALSKLRRNETFAMVTKRLSDYALSILSGVLLWTSAVLIGVFIWWNLGLQGEGVTLSIFELVHAYGRRSAALPGWLVWGGYVALGAWFIGSCLCIVLCWYWQIDKAVLAPGRMVISFFDDLRRGVLFRRRGAETVDGAITAFGLDTMVEIVSKAVGAAASNAEDDDAKEQIMENGQKLQSRLKKLASRVMDSGRRSSTQGDGKMVKKRLFGGRKEAGESIGDAVVKAAEDMTPQEAIQAAAAVQSDRIRQADKLGGVTSGLKKVRGLLGQLSRAEQKQKGPVVDPAIEHAELVREAITLGSLYLAGGVYRTADLNAKLVELEPKLTPEVRKLAESDPTVTSSRLMLIWGVFDGLRTDMDAVAFGAKAAAAPGAVATGDEDTEQAIVDRAAGLIAARLGGEIAPAPQAAPATSGAAEPPPKSPIPEKEDGESLDLLDLPVDEAGHREDPDDYFSQAIPGKALRGEVVEDRGAGSAGINGGREERSSDVLKGVVELQRLYGDLPPTAKNGLSAMIEIHRSDLMDLHDAVRTGGVPPVGLSSVAIGEFSILLGRVLLQAEAAAVVEEEPVPAAPPARGEGIVQSTASSSSLADQGGQEDLASRAKLAVSWSWDGGVAEGEIRRDLEADDWAHLDAGMPGHECRWAVGMATPKLLTAVSNQDVGAVGEVGVIAGRAQADLWESYDWKSLKRWVGEGLGEKRYAVRPDRLVSFGGRPAGLDDAKGHVFDVYGQKRWEKLGERAVPGGLVGVNFLESDGHRLHVWKREKTLVAMGGVDMLGLEGGGVHSETGAFGYHALRDEWERSPMVGAEQYAGLVSASNGIPFCLWGVIVLVPEYGPISVEWAVSAEVRVIGVRTADGKVDPEALRAAGRYFGELQARYRAKI